MIFSLLLASKLISTMFTHNFYSMSWNKARFNVIRLQRRIFKSILVGDYLGALKLQKLLLFSSSARLLSIRYVTQISKLRNLGSNSFTHLSFLDKFKLNSFLFRNVNNWHPMAFKEVIILDPSFPSPFKFQLFSIHDRCWSCLVSFALKPAHEALFSPRNYSFYTNSMIHKLQKVIFTNLSKESYGLQKRVFIIRFLSPFTIFDIGFLLKKILVPRSIKLGVFRFLKVGLVLHLYDRLSDDSHLGFFLANVLFSHVDFVSDSLRIASNLLVFLKPFEDEVELEKRYLKSLSLVGVDGV